jgi:hypothetical protein
LDAEATAGMGTLVELAFSVSWPLAGWMTCGGNSDGRGG